MLLAGWIVGHLCWMALQWESAFGKVLEETYRKWLQYQDDCLRQIQQDPQPAGIYCNRSFDLYACWPDGVPGMLVNVSCPSYLPWAQTVQHGVVRRRCGLDGQWVRDSEGQLWRDMSECEEEQSTYIQELWLKQVMLSFRILYTVGYTLSLLSLLSALIILLSIRKLHCMRNYIHANLFVSFILRAVAVLLKDSLMDQHWSRQINTQADLRDMLSHRAAIGCRIAQVLMQYFVLANHYWFFGEAFYLHSVLITSVFTENNKYLPYVLLGWGTPLMFVIPWMLMKLLKENKECWAINENMNYWWIIRVPVLFASLVNFLIFMKILKVILSKLRADNQLRYPDYKLRLAKATLTLIPLFGVHEMVFIFATDEQTKGVLRLIKVFVTLFLSSFQGFLVAVLYCYSNKEVKAELQKCLQGWRRRLEVMCCEQ
ncbi:glucagon receptor-like [Alosa sapidissima]|uniref:glucagon receptor-like n=1 Tax=Alosa sapidissima TaxID=34773 RepID=UPI001C0A2269|nr:glucagon receptor-like [Alosa sapidissima]